MHLTIISGTARPREKSNTAKIINAFLTGFQKSGNTAEVWYLSDRAKWAGTKAAFFENTNILFALPLYVENVPGIMLEFLASLSCKARAGTRLSFLVQGGFPEASQSRCCERYLKTLPEKLGCVYGGTLIKGDMFGIGLLGEKIGGKMVQPFIEIGFSFGKYGYFHESIITEYSSPEYLSEKQIRESLCLRKFQKWFINRIAKRMGCTERLDAKPYGCNDSSTISRRT